tara:strand:+ start:453 stop:908 length:456 start_codon:yes stop_codon:yes gene_type:complete
MSNILNTPDNLASASNIIEEDVAPKINDTLSVGLKYKDKILEELKYALTAIKSAYGKIIILKLCVEVFILISVLYAFYKRIYPKLKDPETSAWGHQEYQVYFGSKSIFDRIVGVFREVSHYFIMLILWGVLGVALPDILAALKSFFANTAP